MGQKYFYYSHREKPVKCKIKRIGAPRLHALIEARFKALVSAPAMLEKLYKAFQSETKDQEPENASQLKSANEEISKLQVQSRNLLDQLQNLSKGSGDLILQRLQEIEQRTLSIQQEQRRLEHDLNVVKQTTFNPTQFNTVLQGWQNLSSFMTPSERREIVRNLIGSIEVSFKQVRVRYNYDMKSVTSATELFRSVALGNSKKAGQVFEIGKPKSETAFLKPGSLDSIQPSEPFSDGPFAWFQAKLLKRKHEISRSCIAGCDLDVTGNYPKLRELATWWLLRGYLKFPQTSLELEPNNSFLLPTPSIGKGGRYEHKKPTLKRIEPDSVGSGSGSQIFRQICFTNRNRRNQFLARTSSFLRTRLCSVNVVST